ncbi:MAG: cupin domain-containing protein [Gaiellaceae bacterium]
MDAVWHDLGAAAGSADVGVRRIRVAPQRLSTPPHVHAREEETFFVLGGSGLLLQDGETCRVRPGDCVVHAGAEVHTLVGGDEGLDVLVFGPRLWAEGGYLPRSGNLWVGLWPVRVAENHPWQDEAALGMPELPEPRERPANVVHVSDAPSEFGGVSHRLGAAAGARRTGLNHVALPPDAEGAPPHLHTVEEETFVILEGEGVLELWPTPSRASTGQVREEHPVRAGHVLAHPPGGGMAHMLRAGAGGLTYLVYGTRSAADVCFYPRSNKVAFRGVGLIARLEHLEYMDGEPEG